MIPRRTAEEKGIFFSDFGKMHFHRLDVLLWLLGRRSYVSHVFRIFVRALFHALVGAGLGVKRHDRAILRHGEEEAER